MEVTLTLRRTSPAPGSGTGRASTRMSSASCSTTAFMSVSRGSVDGGSWYRRRAGTESGRHGRELRLTPRAAGGNREVGAVSSRVVSTPGATGRGSAMVTPRTPGQRRGLCIALCLLALLAPRLTFAQPSEEEGIATFYSSKFEGKKTASGEAYDKTDAYGTKLRVTNLANGKSAVVTVNDRMNRSVKSVIEVTPRVASSLGFAKAGHARVRVEVVK